MIYPWHEAAWRALSAQAPPSALLFYGKRATGKRTFARAYARLLLCEQAHNGHACGVCASCRLSEHGSHPDFYLLEPDEGSDNGTGRKLAHIKIDAVRALLEPLNQSSMRGGRRVVLIDPAESLNPQAANALLKILEEPPPAVVFLLVSGQRGLLLPTVRSRCRPMPLPAPTPEQALAYLHAQGRGDGAAEQLAFHGGAPLFAAEPEQEALRESLLVVLAEPRLLAVLNFAAEFDRHKYPLALLLDWLYKWLADMALAQYGAAPQYYPARAADSARAAAQTNPATLFRFQADLNRLAPYGHHSLNVKMQAEALLCHYLLLRQKRG
ncbi:DNA polymerase III subunit delta' [Conchiformibius kuhniae]|uniref:DNA polymerase III subunit delta n=1 Tax=Conchiformibius kuhniae TaxID=211502 RepID=A0A8T9MTZ1_9NEIS|nr:DNA polymerase III subunit delta' [Conchiformibius kuhniae]UOP05077.1 DNA polymerase III subunit delta' [Conchiformibius kuhniae]